MSRPRSKSDIKKIYIKLLDDAANNLLKFNSTDDSDPIDKKSVDGSGYCSEDEILFDDFEKSALLQFDSTEGSVASDIQYSSDRDDEFESKAGLDKILAGLEASTLTFHITENVDKIVSPRGANTSVEESQTKTVGNRVYSQVKNAGKFYWTICDLEEGGVENPMYHLDHEDDQIKHFDHDGEKGAPLTLEELDDVFQTTTTDLESLQEELEEPLTINTEKAGVASASTPPSTPTNNSAQRSQSKTPVDYPKYTPSLEERKERLFEVNSSANKDQEKKIELSKQLQEILKTLISNSKEFEDKNGERITVKCHDDRSHRFTVKHPPKKSGDVALSFRINFSENEPATEGNRQGEISLNELEKRIKLYENCTKIEEEKIEISVRIAAEWGLGEDVDLHENDLSSSSIASSDEVAHDSSSENIGDKKKEATSSILDGEFEFKEGEVLKKKDGGHHLTLIELKKIEQQIKKEKIEISGKIANALESDECNEYHIESDLLPLATISPTSSSSKSYDYKSSDESSSEDLAADSASNHPAEKGGVIEWESKKFKFTKGNVLKYENDDEPTLKELKEFLGQIENPECEDYYSKLWSDSESENEEVDKERGLEFNGGSLENIYPEASNGDQVIINNPLGSNQAIVGSNSVPNPTRKTKIEFKIYDDFGVSIPHSVSTNLTENSIRSSSTEVVARIPDPQDDKAVKPTNNDDCKKSSGDSIFTNPFPNQERYDAKALVYVELEKLKKSEAENNKLNRALYKIMIETDPKKAKLTTGDKVILDKHCVEINLKLNKSFKEMSEEEEKSAIQRLKNFPRGKESKAAVDNADKFIKSIEGHQKKVYEAVSETLKYVDEQKQPRVPNTTIKDAIAEQLKTNLEKNFPQRD